MPITVFLADDHRIVRDGLRAILNREEGITVVGDSADGRQTVDRVTMLRPDIVIMDIGMPGLNGIEATRQIEEVRPSTQVIVLSMYGSSEHIYQALQAGARGYLLKEAAGTEVVDAVRAVDAGERYMSRHIKETVIDDYLRRRQMKSPLDLLTPREREVLQLVAEGQSSVEIANRLCLSPKTVDTYRSRLMRKLDIGDIPSLVKFAIRHGLTSLE